MDGPLVSLHFLCDILSTGTVQNSVKTVLPGFGNGWLKCCATVIFWGWQRKIVGVIRET